MHFKCRKAKKPPVQLTVSVLFVVARTPVFCLTSRRHDLLVEFGETTLLGKPGKCANGWFVLNRWSSVASSNVFNNGELWEE